MRPFTFWASIIFFSLTWFVFDDFQRAVICSIWFCALVEASVRTLDGLRAMRELKALAAKIEKENAEG